MNCAMTCGYQFNFLFVVELDDSVLSDDEVYLHDQDTI